MLMIQSLTVAALRAPERFFPCVTHRASARDMFPKDRASTQLRVIHPQRGRHCTG